MSAAAPPAAPAPPRATARALDRVAALPYADPYLAGVGIGIVLLLAFAAAGRGLGASGAFSTVAAAGVAAAAPEAAAASPAFAPYLPRGAASPLGDWLVWQVAGVALGGFASAALAGRLRRAVERGPRITDGARLLLAFGGGAVMGFGAKLARGCTSGLGLTGGATLAVGSWAFVACAFAAAYAAAPLLRRAWR